MLGSSMNWITTVIGFAMSATFIVFICARLICGRMRRFESPPMFEIDSRMIDLEQVILSLCIKFSCKFCMFPYIGVLTCGCSWGVIRQDAMQENVHSST